MDKSRPLASTVPDGGWGWVIVAAVALINMTNQSILSVFGLLFGSRLKDMQQATSIAALIINLNSMALNFSGVFIGPAIKSFKPRNVAASGCLLVSFGMLWCAFATRPWHFIVGYGFFVGLGLGLIAPSTFIAINSYFNKKRGRAVGISLAGASLGQIFIPHLVRFCLDNYDFRTAALIMSLLSLTGLFGAMLLRPLQKHNNCQHIAPLLENVEKNPQKCSDMEVMVKQNDRVYNDTTVLRKTAPTHEKINAKLHQRLVKIMDLDLLADPVFWNVTMGISLVYTSTINFTLLFPNFLQYSVGLTTTTTATCMSVIAGADNISRLLLPCITDKLNASYRLVFLLGSVGLLISRAALAESTNIITITVMSMFIGLAKSATVINNNLAVSEHCPADKLPSGIGLNMLSKGIVVLLVGQVLGWIHDYTNSYIQCLHAQNALLLAVILMWTPEIYYRYWKQRKQIRRCDLTPVRSEEKATMEHC